MSGGQRTLVAVVVAALALAAPWFAYPVFLMTALCFALFACAFNLLLGYAGLMSFGHAMFFGMAGYFYGNVVKVWGLPPELGLVAGVLGAAALGVVTGALAIRRQGIYFAMITLAFAQMVYFFCVQAPFTGGEDGLQGIPRRALLGGLLPIHDDRVLYYVVLAIFLFGFGAIYRFIHSPFGQILKAIRDNEQRALSLGYEADRYKLLAFVLSAALAGLAGATKAMVMQFATLTDVSAGDVGRGRADGAGRRAGHHRRTRGRRLHHRHHAELSRRLRRIRAGDPGRHLRGHRHGLPQGPGRRGRRLVEVALGREGGSADATGAAAPDAARHAAGRVIAGRGVVPQARVIAGATSTTRKGRATPSCSVTVTYSPFTNRCRSKRKIGSSSSSPGS